MEQTIAFMNRLILLTTAGDYGECQKPEWWDEAEIVIQIDDRGGRVLKGEHLKLFHQVTDEELASSHPSANMAGSQQGDER